MKGATSSPKSRTPGGQSCCSASRAAAGSGLAKTCPGAIADSASETRQVQVRNELRGDCITRTLQHSSTKEKRSWISLVETRRFATRYEKTVRNYAAVIAIGCVLLWLRL